MIPQEYQVPLLIEVVISLIIYYKAPTGQKMKSWLFLTGFFVFMVFKGHILNEVTGIYGGSTPH